VTLLSKEDLADIRFVAERAGGLGLNPHSTLKLLDGYEALVATLDDVSRGSTHELVRHLLEKLIAAEKEVARAPAQPAAPEPSADEEFDDFKPVSEPERREVGIVVPRAELTRLQAAESQLAAVTSERDSLLRRIDELQSYTHQTACAIDQLAAVRAIAHKEGLSPRERWERIVRMLPAPSPGAGGGK
jgi:hypothetical protein